MSTIVTAVFLLSAPVAHVISLPFRCPFFIRSTQTHTLNDTAAYPTLPIFDFQPRVSSRLARSGGKYRLRTELVIVIRTGKSYVINNTSYVERT